jgi:transposase
MELTKQQFAKIAHLFPKPRGSFDISHYDAMRAILYVAENGCKWRKLPKEYGNWHTVYTRMSRWSKNGVLCRVFEALQKERLVKVSLEVASLDSTCIKVHPDASGALKKQASSPSAKRGAAGTPSFIWLPQMTGRP